jgi:methionyl-tRNA formyltransferase
MVGGSPRLRIVFFGTPEFAVPTLRTLLDSRHDVVALVSQPDRPKGRGHHLVATPTKALADSRGLTVLQPAKLRDDQFLKPLAAFHADLGVVAAYGRILPEQVLQIPRLGLVNVHASLLPKYRGAAPIHRAVIAGEVETGVTIMRVVLALDAGAMFANVRRPIGPDETSVQVERGLADLGAALLLEVVDQIDAGCAHEVAQDEAQATYAPKIVKAEGAIDWTLAARAVHDLVRGLQPWPLVSASIEGRRYLIHRTSVTDERSSAEPATIVSAVGDTIAVAAGDGRLLHIVEIQPEGRRAMSAREFLAGHSLPAGARLHP